LPYNILLKHIEKVKNVIFDSGMKKTTAYFIGFWFVILSGIFNRATGSVTTSNLRFQYLTTEEGLPQNTVDCIFQDSRGFMWFGTWNGLCRYDGYAFKTYQKGNQQNGLPDNFVRSLAEDHSGNLWIGTAQGVVLFNPVKEEFFLPEKIQETIANSAVTSILCDHSGVIWIGDEKGELFCIVSVDSVNGIHDRIITQINTDVLIGRSINEVYGQKNGTILVGTASGVFKVESEMLQKFKLPSMNASVLDNVNVKSIYEARNSDLYIGTDIGLYWIHNQETLYLTPIVNDPTSLSHATITAITEDNRGTVLIGTLGGLDFFYPSDRRIERINGRDDENGRLNNEFVNSLFVDSGENVWIGTDKGGVNKFSMFQKPFYSMRNHRDEINSLSHNTINSIFKDGSILWVGTAGGGLNRIDSKSGRINRFIFSAQNTNGLHNDYISAICKDHKNQLWVGTWGGGLSKLLSENNNVFQTFINLPNNRNSVASSFISSIYSDDRGFLVVGTLGGLDIFNPKSESFLHFNAQLGEGFENPEVGCILKDRNDFYWIGSRKGLFRIPARLVNLSGEKLKSSDFSFFTNNPNDSLSIPGNYVISLLEDRKGNVWIGTYGNGICKAEVTIDGKVFYKTYTQDDGLCNNVIYSMENDLDGNIWISTDKGLSKFNPDQGTFENFYTKDGLLSDQFYWSASEADSAGILYFGGVNGLNYFKPKEIVSYPRKPKIVFTDFRVFNRSVAIGEKLHGKIVLENSISGTKSLELSYRDNVFSIEFSALDYFLPDKVTYAYKMEGVDQNWVIVPSSRRFAGYTNLAGGEYRFLVKAANSDGVWSDEVSVLEIVIQPPFWQTGWFRFVFLLAVILMVLGYIRYRTYLLHAQKRKLEKQVHERTLQIEEQTQKLQEQSEILKQSNYELANWQVLIEGQKIELEKQNQLIAEQRDEVIELNQKVSLINQLRLRFFTNISHEFRTPLTLILDPLESLMKSLEGDQQTIQTLKLINRNAQRLLHLINQLMNFRRIETGKVELRVVNGDLISFIHEIFISFQDLANHQRINYSFHAAEIWPATWFDPEKLENIFYNLLSNAFKFTPESGNVSVNITFGQTDNNKQGLPTPYVQVDIIDSGKGIASENLPFVFDRFYQAESTADNRLKGSGIGLALTQELVHAVHGKVSVESEINRGSTFSVLLPYRAEDFDENELDRTGSVLSVNLQAKVDLMTEEILRTESFEDIELQLVDKSKSLILIVEDNYDLRTFLLQSMRTEFRVMGAENGKEGFELAKKYTPDLIVSDIMMPVMDGLELCSRLKKEIHTCHIPVILLTAKAMIEHWIEGLETGADEYIPKPFNLQILEAKMKNLIESRRKLKRMFSQGETVDPSELTSNSVDEEFLAKAYRILEKNYLEPEFSASQFASEMFVSRSLLYKKIRAITDLNITDFINSFKLKKAVELIQENKLLIADIAFNVGFNDPKYFSRIFRKFYGMSPSEFKSKK